MKMVMEEICFFTKDFKLQEYLSKSKLNCFNECIFFVDNNKQITYWNKNAEKITGYTPEEVLNLYCYDNILQMENESGIPLCKSTCLLTASLQKGDFVEEKVYLSRKDGKKILVWKYVSPIKNQDNNIIGSVHIFVDEIGYEQLKKNSKVISEIITLFSKELESARLILNAIQSNIEPPYHIDFSLNYKPHYSIGGDYFGIININEYQSLIYVGDMSYKGINAAIMTGFLKNEFSLIINELKHKNHLNTAKILTKINSSTYHSLKSMNQQASAWCGLFDSKTMNLTYSSAGHEIPIIVNNDKISFIDTKNNNKFGIKEYIEFTDNSCKLKPSDRIIFYTDGIIKQISNENSKLTLNWLLNEIEKSKNDTPSVIAKRIFDEVEKFCHGTPQLDDFLLFVVALKEI